MFPFGYIKQDWRSECRTVLSASLFNTTYSPNCIYPSRWMVYTCYWSKEMVHILKIFYYQYNQSAKMA